MTTNINRKNLKLKNIIFMSPLSRTKLNIPNLISQTKRILTTTANNQILNVSNYINKSNKILNDIYRSYSTNRNIKSTNSNKKKRIRKKIILKIQILLQILRKFLLFLNLLPV